MIIRDGAQQSSARTTVFVSKQTGRPPVQIVTCHISFIQKVAKLETAIARRQVLSEPLERENQLFHVLNQHLNVTVNLIAVAHQVVRRDERLENNHPV